LLQYVSQLHFGVKHQWSFFPRKINRFNTAADPWSSADNHKPGADNMISRPLDTRRSASAQKYPQPQDRFLCGISSSSRGAPIGLRLVVLNYWAFQILFPLIASIWVISAKIPLITSVSF